LKHNLFSNALISVQRGHFITESRTLLASSSMIMPSRIRIWFFKLFPMRLCCISLSEHIYIPLTDHIVVTFKRPSNWLSHVYRSSYIALDCPMCKAKHFQICLFVKPSSTISLISFFANSRLGFILPLFESRRYSPILKAVYSLLV
jgi:hypothetical protein